MVVGEETRFAKPDQVSRLPFPLLLRVAIATFACAWSTKRIPSSNATDIVVARVDVRGVIVSTALHVGTGSTNLLLKSNKLAEKRTLRRTQCLALRLARRVLILLRMGSRKGGKAKHEAKANANGDTRT